MSSVLLLLCACPNVIDERVEKEGPVVVLHLTIIGVSAITTAYKIAVILAVTLRWRMATKGIKFKSILK